MHLVDLRFIATKVHAVIQGSYNNRLAEYFTNVSLLSPSTLNKRCSPRGRIAIPSIFLRSLFLVSRDGEGATPLHRAVAGRHSETAQGGDTTHFKNISDCKTDPNNDHEPLRTHISPRPKLFASGQISSTAPAICLARNISKYRLHITSK